MNFKQWFIEDQQSQSSLFMMTDKSSIGPKPSSNRGLPKPSDGWGRGKYQPNPFFMKKKMKKK